ncbi:MAG: non-homologous end-joining DNA ligase [Clostridia bacterium]|nr:non-homologous end-joining DNA ligase [Clostridia bacterium]
MGLAEYHKKRNFTDTREPKGKVTKTKTKAPRFVIQYHEARAKHYDLRLEYNGILLSWAVPKGLSNNPNDKRLAIQVEDHPIDYAQFSGIIPKGNYGAGTVEIFDNGTYTPIKDFTSGLKKGHLKFILHGKKLQGAWSLMRFQNNHWFAVKMHDEFANTLPFHTTSVQLATLAAKLPTGRDWIYEIKYDGYRIVAYVEKQKVKLLTRNGQDYTAKLATIAQSLSQLPCHFCVLDGEVVCLDPTGRSDFGLLQNSLKSGKQQLYYCVFDLLAWNGKDLRSEPLIERKTKLANLLTDAANNLMYAGHTTHGAKTLAFAKAHELEGIIAKRKKSIYTGTRSDDWLKIKCYHRQEFVIIGYTTTAQNKVLSALLLGYYAGKQLTYVGKVGTGFTEKSKQTLVATLQAARTDKCPLKLFKTDNKNIIWLQPQFVAEIQYAELTKDKLLRQPSFIGLRTDKKPQDITLEQNGNDTNI